MINIRIAEPSDAEAILAIYSHYIKTTAITITKKNSKETSPFLLLLVER